MIIGKRQELKVVSEDRSGYRLQCAQGDEVFLPGVLTQAEEKPKIGEEILVFIYLDSNGDRLATARLPFAEVGEFAALEVKDVTPHGAFMNFGLPKDLLVPNKLQKEQLQKGDIHLVKIELEEKTGRLFGNARASAHVARTSIDLEEKQVASMVPFSQTPMGFKVLINNRYIGMAYHNEIHFEVVFGQTYQGTVKTLRPDGHIDVILKVVGARGRLSDIDTVVEALKANGGSLTYNSQTDPEEIRERFGMSKKAFKQAVGNLYKKRLIRVLEDKIEFV